MQLQPSLAVNELGILNYKRKILSAILKSVVWQ